MPVANPNDNNCASYLAIALANYLGGVLCKKVAVSCASDLSLYDCLKWYKQHILKAVSGNDTPDYFELAGIKYFHNIPNEFFDYIILAGDNPFLFNDHVQDAPYKRIAVGSITPWTYKHYSDFLKRMSPFYQGNKEWFFLAWCNSAQDKKALERTHKVPIHQIPTDLDPFMIRQQDFSFLEKLIL
ncbi:MAG: hypothetical protein IJW18_01045 [Lachnospiraceae bacterium]|nr:hypothetical protein [Lachnospiraceae bacterium]